MRDESLNIFLESKNILSIRLYIGSLTNGSFLGRRCKALCRKIPRVFLFDCCSGDNDRDTDFRASSIDDGKRMTFLHSDKVKKEKEEKEIKMDDTETNTETENVQENNIWARDEDNPDHRLVVINAANPGFQSKMRTDTGSYVITHFIDGLKDNIFKNKNKLFINDILSDIQHSLHKEGKQLVEKNIL